MGARRWSSSTAPEHLPPPEKRAGCMNEPMSNSADTAKVESKTAQLSWPFIHGMFSKWMGILVNKRESDEKKLEAVASSSVAVATQESQVTGDDALNLSATTASKAIEEPKNQNSKQCEAKLGLSGSERRNYASTIIKEVSMEDVLNSGEMLDHPPSGDVTKTEKAIELIEMANQGTEHERPNSTREGPGMKIKSPAGRTDETERLLKILELIVTENKQTELDNGVVKVSRRDAISRQVMSESKTGPGMNELEATESSNRAIKDKGPLLKRISAEQSKEMVAVTSNSLPGHLDKRNNLSAGERKKDDRIKGLMDYIMNIPLEYPQVRSRDTDAIRENGKMSQKGSKNLRQQLSDKEKPAIKKQTTHEVDKQKSRNGASHPVIYHVASELSGCVVPLDVKSLGRTPGSKSKNAHVSQTDRLQQMVEGMDRVRKPDGHYESSDTCPNITIPETINDPDVPNALLKNPTRTVKIVGLTHGVTLYQLKESLELRAGSISSLFLGSSSSVAYAEFKTQDAKETAIALHSINVAGKHLRLLRVDSPKTNVVRISNLNMISVKDITSICERYGRVQKEMRRSDAFVDVYFELFELPNMLSILNSLNGMQVEGTRMTAVPAPVFPEEVLRVLWDQPGGRRHLKSVLHSLLQKIDCHIDTSRLRDRLSEYYTDQLRSN
ncbi:uncharacterized protein LOC116193076 isoform X2 [Punica granatum]|nr:uncharacterized protein LOC116193076 isoform X2 [Punica granatum]OWM85773.1 hypothetical protein CDL15_Pgr023706 [Punica granatum]